MRLPVIKAVVDFIEENDADYIHETVEVLECLAEAKGINDEELEVIGELMSNLFGALEVAQAIQGQPARITVLLSLLVLVSKGPHLHIEVC